MDNQWHLDKRVPLALILMILGQTAIGGWMIRGLYDEVKHTSQQLSTYSEMVGDMQSRLFAQEAKNSTVEMQLKSIDRTQQQILLELKGFRSELHRIELSRQGIAQ